MARARWPAMRLATWRGSRLSGSSPLMPRRRGLAREIWASGQEPSGLERRGGVVGEDRKQAQVVTIEPAETELGERDDADGHLVVAHRDDEHRFVDIVGAGDRGAPRVRVR